MSLFDLLSLTLLGSLGCFHQRRDADEHQQHKQTIDARASKSFSEYSSLSMLFGGHKGSDAENQAGEDEQHGSEAEHNHRNPVSAHLWLQEQANTERHQRRNDAECRSLLREGIRRQGGNNRRRVLNRGRC